MSWTSMRWRESTVIALAYTFSQQITFAAAQKTLRIAQFGDSVRVESWDNRHASQPANLVAPNIPVAPNMPAASNKCASLRVALVLRNISDHLRGNLHGILDYVQRSNPDWEVYTEGALPCLPWERLPEWEGEGLIVAVDTNDQLARVRAKDVSTVNISSRLAGLDIPTVVSDNEAIGELAAEHLLGKGLRHFAFAGPMDLDHNVRRLAGFQRALRQSNAGVDQLLIRFLHRQLDHDRQSMVDTRHLGEQLLTLPLPVGVFAPHDDMGCWVIKACQEVGLKIPNQVAVLGVDNLELLCNFTRPPLSSIAQSSFRIGYEAARMLDTIMSGGAPAERLLLIPPSTIVARQSTDVLAIEDQDVAHALLYIRNHAYLGINVQDIVDRVSVSRRSLEMRFRQAVGHSIEHELINVRMTRAKSLLSDSQMPITQVAANSGYQSSTGFSVAFRKET
ncbi:MAG: DNA-binding transcriptional regulator, partial [Planctomycetales bacterium]|nr:DNA-binding transcriptional regulator [Planctomycetales bacterium]